MLEGAFVVAAFFLFGGAHEMDTTTSQRLHGNRA